MQFGIKFQFRFCLPLCFNLAVLRISDLSQNHSFSGWSCPCTSGAEIHWLVGIVFTQLKQGLIMGNVEWLGSVFDVQRLTIGFIPDWSPWLLLQYLYWIVAPLQHKG